MKIDVHAHFYPVEYLNETERLLRDDPRVAARDTERVIAWARSDPRMWSVEQRLAAMDEAELELEILSLSIPNVYLGDRGAAVALTQMANDAYLQLARDYPRRFRVFASVPLQFPEEALRELDRVGNEPEVVGVVLGANLDGEQLSRPDFFPFYAELERRELPIFIHPMRPAGIEAMMEYSLAPIAGYLFDSTLAALRLVFSGVFEQHPRLGLIMPHLGAVLPYMMGRVEHAYETYLNCKDNLSAPPETYFKRFYYDTVSRSVPALRCAAEIFGPEHIVFGTDFPFWTDMRRLYRDVEELSLPAEQEAGVFEGNIYRALPKLKLAAPAETEGSASPA